MTKDDMQKLAVTIMRAVYGLDSPSCVHDDGEGGIDLEYRWGGKASRVRISAGEIRMNNTKHTALSIAKFRTREASDAIFGREWRGRRAWQHQDADNIGAHYQGA